jgi:uridine kinase
MSHRDGRYQAYDWGTDTMGDWRIVPTGGVVIIEGVMSIRNEIRHYYDYTIWVTCER